MPSTRRVKLLSLTLALVILSLLYLSSSSRSSNADFYDRTVAGLEARAQKAAEAAHMAPQKAPPKAAPPPTEDVQRPMKDSGSGASNKAEDGGARVVKDTSAGAGEGKETGDGGKEGKEVEKERTPPQVGQGRGKWSGSGDNAASSGGEEAGPEDEETLKARRVEATLNDILKKGPIIIFSKSYCPYSKKAKRIFEQYQITPSPYIVELDEAPLGPELQEALGKITKRRTVPNILIGGTSIGGGDDVERLHNEGNLVAKIKEFGGKRIMEARLLDSKVRKGMESRR